MQQTSLVYTYTIEGNITVEFELYSSAVRGRYCLFGSINGIDVPEEIFRTNSDEQAIEIADASICERLRAKGVN